uniref:DNA-directed RNA polymerase n=1 Tax=Euglena anabaena TaxID=38273 RepID=A0A0G3F6P5_EUGAN|nr:RNA polymerase beta'' subunit [Euglenaria anabaena]AKJ83329.1 RNA polymerase beta'' subunit [Euglenaria anabaena]
MINKYKNKLQSNKTFDKGEIKKLINWFIKNYGAIRTTKLLDKLKSLGFNFTTKAGISLGIEDLKIPETKKLLFKNTEIELNHFDIKLKKGEINIFQRLEKITKTWNNTNENLKKDLINNFRQTDILNPVYIMTFSGARGNISQIRQLIGMRGLMSDSQGEIIGLPIKSNLKEGLKVTEYFISCYGARKGLVDTALKTANSGYLTRRLVYVAQGQIIKQPDCGTKNGIIISVSRKTNKSEYKIEKEKLIGRVLANDIIDEESGKLVASMGQDICEYIAKKIIKIRKIYVRSPLTCRLNTGICQICYGWNLGNGRMVELGESVGILAAQSIGEPGTQLTMRTFHTGGVFTGETEETINSPHNGIISYDAYKDGKEIETKYGEKAFFTLQEKKIKVSENKFHQSIIKLPKYTTIFVKPNKKVFSEQILAERSTWQQIIQNKSEKYKETRQIKTKISGQIYFDKIKSSKEKVKIEKGDKGKIWILSGNILSNKLLVQNLEKENYTKIKKNKNFTTNKKEIKRINDKSHRIKINNKTFTYFGRFKKNVIINKKNKTTLLVKRLNLQNNFLQITKNSKIYTNKKQKIKVGEFFNINQAFTENKKNKYCNQIVQTGFNKVLLRKANVYLTQKTSKINIKNNFLIKKNNVLFQILYTKEKTTDIVQGLPKIEEFLEAKKTSNLEIIRNNPHEKLKKEFNKLQKKYNNKTTSRLSIQKIQKFLINKIQSVYESQGVKVSDKHMEIIIKQMTSKVIIKEQGDSTLLTGELIELNKIEKINENLKGKAKYEPIILGISKLSLSSQSFISEASFQETTRILTKSAIEGRIDWLYGLKENIVIGNLIPVGTGYKNQL